ncbi:MAG: RNA methyltransferase [Actinomyces sp.]|nr:MAG: RNA methyltransferase [Actinomyces sp.]
MFGRLARTVTPQPLLALAPRPAAVLPTRLDRDDIVLVLVGVSDPGNVGTLVRVADAVAAVAVVSVGGADPFGPKAVRASAGSVLRVPVVTGHDARSVIGSLRDAGATVVATDPHGGAPHDTGVLRPPLAIVLGSEPRGLDPDVASACTTRVRIDLPGRAESLNVAMAGTLLAVEAHRNRGG